MKNQQRQELFQLGQSLVSDLDLNSVLSSVLRLARQLTEARYAAIGVLASSGDSLERFITSGVDEEEQRKIGDLPTGKGVLGVLIRDPRPIRLTDVSKHPASSGFPSHHPPMKTFLGVPILIRGQAYGNLYLTDKSTGEFTEADEEATVALASWAAIAVDNARSVARERLQESLASAEKERTRWSRELHDDTLQGLAALRVILVAASGSKDPEALRQVVDEAVDQLGIEIQNLRSLITDLRPAALDSLGLIPAIEDLVARSQSRFGLAIALVAAPDVDASIRQLDNSELETTIYRVIQESITNAGKHANADELTITVRLAEGMIEAEVRDNGTGFDSDGEFSGFGLKGMSERVELGGGNLIVRSAPGSGTIILATLPTEPGA